MNTIPYYDCPVKEFCQHGTWRWDLNENKIYYSALWKTMLGFSETEIENSLEEWLTRVHEDDRQTVIQSLNSVKIDGRDIMSLNYRILTKNNIYKWMRCATKTIVYDGIKPLEIAGMQYDIHELKSNEEFLNEINIRLGKLVENFSGGILLEDEYRKIFHVNNEFRSFFKIKETIYDLIGSDFENSGDQFKHLFTEPQSYFDSTEAAVRNQKAVSGEIFTMSDGTILERDYIPIKHENNHKGHLWLYRDVTKFKKTEQKLEYRFRFERLIADLSLQFINLNLFDIDVEIENSLCKIGEFISADRGHVFLFSKMSNYTVNTHEWIKNGIIGKSIKHKKFLIDLYPRWKEKIMNKEIVNLHTCDELPENDNVEKEIFKSKEIKSLVVLPMIYNNVSIGFIGFISIFEKRMWAEDTVNLLNVAAGVITNAIKRKEYEEALKKSEAKYKSVVNNIKEVIFQTDAQGLWTFLNPAWTEITGFMIEESIGTNFIDYVHKDDREKNKKLFKPLIAGEKKYCRCEMRYYTKDGGYKWVEVYAQLIFDENNNVIGTSGTLNDITKRKISEVEIRKLSRAVETTPSAIMLSDLYSKIIYVNPGLLNMSNYSDADQLIGKDIFGLTNEDGKKLLIESIIPQLLRGETWNGEIELRKADGEIFPSEMSCSAVNDESGIPQYLVANFYDLTERKKAENEIKKALQKEKELNELKSRFVSMVSHEFRTPLAAILSSSDLLELYWDKWNPEKRVSLLGKIKKSIKNLIDILNDVTEINRADSGKTKISPEDIELIKLINEIVEELKTCHLEKPNIHFNHKNGEQRIISDNKLLRQVFVNLISNAIKYTPTEKNIYINLEYNEDMFTFSVKDEGIGIPEKDLPNLFQPFMRSNNTGKIKGTGLGLSIVKKAVELLKGEIAYTSKVDLGSEFTVKIPNEANT